MLPRSNVDRLRDSAPVILPSVLLCDFTNLESEVRRFEAAGAQALHLDVMDGCFVPNLTFGLPIVKAFRRLTDLPLDVHLMIAHPDRYIEQFFEAGADLLTIHSEAVDDPRPILERIRRLGAGAGIALNPSTPVESLDGCLDLCDLALVMSVPAGFGAQQFNPVVLDKIERLRDLTAGRVMLEVDGGINHTTIGRCAAAGAAYFVVGSAITSQPEYARPLQELGALLETP